MKFSELVKTKPKAQWKKFNDLVSFKVEPLDNDSYQIGFNKYVRYLKAQDNKVLNLDVAENEMSEASVQCELFAKYILTDWKGITDEDGEEVEYSIDMAFQMLKSNTDVFLFVFEASNNLEADVNEEKNSTVKKSVTSTNTASKSGTKNQK